MFNNKKIEELSEKIKQLEKKHSLLLEYLELTEKYDTELTFGSVHFPHRYKKILIGYEKIKKCKTCKKILNDI